MQKEGNSSQLLVQLWKESGPEATLQGPGSPGDYRLAVHAAGKTNSSYNSFFGGTRGLNSGHCAC
jgi:hypothetical protein